MNTQKMIQVLLTAIDSGSLTRAGEILGYTQSNLTQMVKSFEDEIGFPLLIKTKKGVEPTREALQLLPTMLGSLRQSYGSAAPFEILAPVWISSSCALSVALIIAAGLNKRKRRL